jgi:siroheme synthase-like protein
MRFLPIALDVRHRACVVVGGGAVGCRKALKLAEAGAEVTVVSPKLGEGLLRAVEDGRVRWIKERFRSDHLVGAYVVVMATDDPVLNAAGALLAAQERALACDASSASHSQFIFGALLEDAGVTVATFTDGRDPALARRVRDEIAGLLAARKTTGTQPSGAGGPTAKEP